LHAGCQTKKPVCPNEQLPSSLKNSAVTFRWAGSVRKLVLQISATLTPWSKHQSDTSLRHENAAWQEPRPRMAQLKDKVEPGTPLLHHPIQEVTPRRIQALETVLTTFAWPLLVLYVVTKGVDLE
jgi:hypothetical protein